MADAASFEEIGVLRRHPSNPLLSAADVPYPASLVFNAGVVRYEGRYVMVFRNDYGPADADDFRRRGEAGRPRWDGTNLGLAVSDDGIAWTVEPNPCISLDRARELVAGMMPGMDPARELHRFYDPRLTVIDGRVAMCFAVDTAHGLRGGVAVTDDFDDWEVLSLSVPDNRNMALFPETLDGRYVRYERSVNTFGGNRLSDDQAMMWLSHSPDLRHWGFSHHVLATERIAFANSKMGPGAPPVRTDRGWLTTFHAVWRDETRGKRGWEDRWPKVYRAGLMLTDLDQPWRIVGMCPRPLLSPTTWYETGDDAPDGVDFEGFRCDVIFPGGMILEDSDEVKIYYGAADTVECVATADVGDLIKACTEA